MSALIKKIQNQKASPQQNALANKQKFECNYRDNYYGDKTCVPCAK